MRFLGCAFLRYLGWAVSLALFSATAAAQTPGQTQANAPAEKVPTGIAATVNDQPIMEMVVYRAVRRLPQDKQAAARTEILNYLIDNAILDQSLQQLHVEVNKKEVDGKMDQIKTEIVKSGQPVDKVLAGLMLTEDELRAQLTAELRWEKYCNDQVSDKMLREFFDSNPEMFDGTLVRARHILLSPPATDARAMELAREQLLKDKQQIEADVTAGLAKLPATADAATRERERSRLLNEAFAALAKKESTCPSKDQGGDLGWFPRAGSMVEPFAKTAYSLKPGEMSDVVATQFGYHLILVSERKQGQPPKFEDAKEVVKEVYCDRMRDALCAKQRPMAKIVITPQAKP
jgi:peptidyl-prolyl cis-trans isomerase C